jgi:hypothetical protein
MTQFMEMVKRSTEEPAIDRIFQMDPMLRILCLRSITGNGTLADAEKAISDLAKLAGLGWFERRRLLSSTMDALRAVKETQLCELARAGCSYLVLDLIVELALAHPKNEQSQALARLVANVRARAGNVVAMFGAGDAAEVAEGREPDVAHDAETVQELAHRVAAAYSDDQLDAIQSGIAASLKDEDGKMDARRRKLYRAVKAGFERLYGGMDGEAECPNCGSERFEVVSRERRGTVSKAKEFRETTTRGARTKVMKVGYDRTRESRICEECSHEWDFDVEVEH